MQAYLMQMSSWGRHVHAGEELSTPMYPKRSCSGLLCSSLSHSRPGGLPCKKSTLMALCFSSTNTSVGFFLPVHVMLAPRESCTPIPACDRNLIWGRVFVM